MSILINAEIEIPIEQIQGKIKKIIFNQNNFMVGILLTSKGEEIIFKGKIFGVEREEEIIFKGKWVEHYKYGKQFEITNWERPIPKTKEKIIAYLSSPFIKGCGQKQAIQIASELGENAIEKIIQEREKALINIKGIGKTRAAKIVQSVLATYELQNIINKLCEYGINPEIGIKIYEKHKAQTLDILMKNPYELIKTQLVSFPKADEIAKRMKISPLSSYRIEACINYILNKECYSSGHCFLPEKELIDQTIKLLNENTADENKIDEHDIMQSIFNLEEKTIIIENGIVYPKDLYIYETKSAEKINFLLASNQNKINNKKLELYIKEYQLKNKIVLGEEQKEAIKIALQNNITILTGSAGTGKTTVVKAIIEIYQKLFPEKTISLSAPTGRASRRLQEATGYFAQTIHKLLGYKQNKVNGKQAGFEYDENNKLSHDFFIVDEMSMVDLHLIFSLLRAIRNNSKLLLIGDVNQLPSINAGNVLKDLLETNDIPKVYLTQIYRQAKNSQIITNAHKVIKGENIEVDHSKGDMYFINQQTDEEIQKMIIQSVLRFIELGYSVSDILVLSPMKKGEIGTIELNNQLQKILNPEHENKKEIRYGKRVFRVGDKIMQTVNQSDKGIYNGDIGIITDIKKEKITKNGKEVEVDTIYSDFQGLLIKHTRDEWNEIELAYSISIHKSQGGQSPIVIIPISKSHYNMLARNLIYTGMTRAEKKLVLIGQKYAFEFGIKNNKISLRNTQLKQRIKLLIENRIKKLV